MRKSKVRTCDAQLERGKKLCKLWCTGTEGLKQNRQSGACVNCSGQDKTAVCKLGSRCMC